MIRFVDLTNQIIENDPLFAFFDTVTDRFKEFDGSQTWETVEEFKEHYNGDELERYLKLIPESWK